MVMTTPSTAATIPRPGRESAMVESAAMGWSAVMVDVHVQLHHLIHVEGLDAATGGQTNVSQTKCSGVMVFQKFRIFGEDWAFVGAVAVGFEGHEAFFARAAEELVHHFHGVEIFFFAEFGTAKSAEDAAHDGFENVEGVGDQHGADGGAADDDEFGGLHEDFQVAVLHQVAGDDGAENNDDADDYKHGE